MREPRPYFDDDFEVFIDASQSNYFYVEFEMNARSQTPQTLGVSFFWRALKSWSLVAYEIQDVLEGKA